VPAQINVRANVVRVAHVVDKADERIGHVVVAALLIGILNCFGVAVDDSQYRLAPLLDDPVEVAVEQVRRFVANLDAFGGTAPNRRTPQARERLLDLGE
jgi:hypothetical protein